MGAISGAATAGIGQAFGAVGGIGKELGRASAHALSSGGISKLGGGDFWSGAAAGFIGSGVGSATHNFKPHWQIAGSALSGGLGAELGGGDFWQGAAFGGIVATANHGLHALIEELENRSLIRRIKRKGWKPIDLSKHPYKKVVEGFRIADLYNDGKLPQLNEQFPKGMRIQDLFDFSTAIKSAGWRKTGGNYGTRYWLVNPNKIEVQLHGNSFKVGHIEPRRQGWIQLFDDSSWNLSRIGYIKYTKAYYSHWQVAVNWIRSGKKN